MADVDPKAAKRAERQVATLFGISALGTVLTLVVYFAVKFDTPMSFIEHCSTQRGSAPAASASALALALFGIGAGAVHWAKTLMPDEERVEDRHLLRGSDEDRGDAVGILKEGAAGVRPRPPQADPQHPDRRAGARAAAGRRVSLRDMGPLPGDNLSTTRCGKAGMRLLTDPQRAPDQGPRTCRSGSSSTSSRGPRPRRRRLPGGEGQGRRRC